MAVSVPRIALLLSGLPRQWRVCLASQMALLKGYPYDVFFHFWDTIDAQEKAGLVDLLKPKAYIFEEPQDFTHLDTDPSIRPDLINAPSRVASQLFSRRGVGQLVEPFKHDYQVGIRSRADLQFVYSLDHIIPRLKPHELVVNWWQKNITFSDLFAVGGIEPVLYYHTLYNCMRNHIATMSFNPEVMLTLHLKANNDITTYIEPRQLFFVRRPHMENYTIEQAMNENPGRNKWLDPEVTQNYADYHRRMKGEEGLSHFNEVQRAQLALMHDMGDAKDDK